MTVITSNISDSDLSRIAQLRSLVSNDLTSYYNTDFNLMRWLQGHSNLPIEQIARKLTFHLKLRKSTWKLDEMGSEPREHPIHRHWRHGITGQSRKIDNVIVNIEQCGRTDYTGMMESFSLSDVMRARVPDLEEMLAMCMQLEKKTGRQAWILYVMDVSGLEYNRKLYDLVTGSMRALAEFMADHYVEMIKFFVPVCLPSYASVLYTVVRPLLPERTRDKVRILSSSCWKDELLELANKEVLPSFWNDDKHQFEACVDLPVPYPVEKYYIHRGLKAPAKTTTVDVGAGKFSVQTFSLEAGDVISWWIAGNRNMGFGFFRADQENDEDFMVMDQVTPAFLCSMPGPIIVPLEERIEIQQPGFYKIWYNNNSSWWSTLTVQQSITVEKRK